MVNDTFLKRPSKMGFFLTNNETDYSVFLKKVSKYVDLLLLILCVLLISTFSNMQMARSEQVTNGFSLYGNKIDKRMIMVLATQIAAESSKNRLWTWGLKRADSQSRPLIPEPAVQKSCRYWVMVSSMVNGDLPLPRLLRRSPFLKVRRYPHCLGVSHAESTEFRYTLNS
ncbi:hypothetical protein [Pseudomonas sp. R26(2017)]|uniref:hypothetical protein n=1 Tax=Pseudomonas sp. R26(2017) TaxID=1981695 RepID=UPI001C45083E|nr:hypothetical protein [Pseudomonas sp. R26(2017)]